jgi:hypothetical protein
MATKTKKWIENGTKNEIKTVKIGTQTKKRHQKAKRRQKLVKNKK